MKRTDIVHCKKGRQEAAGKPVQKAKLASKYNLTFQSLLDVSADTMILSDPEGTIIVANAAASRLFGKRRNQIIGGSIYELINPDAVKQLKEYVSEAISNKKEINADYSGQGIYKYHVIHPLLNTSGKVTGIALIRHDLTKFKHLEEAAHRHEMYFKQLIESSPISMMLLSWETGQFIQINSKFTELSGYTIEDIPDLDHWKNHAYPDPKYRALVGDKIVQTVKGQVAGEVKPMEVCITCKDGSQKVTEVHMSRIGDMELIAGIDISDRRQLERRLQEAAWNDFLTGLPNRMLLSDRMQIALANAHRNNSKLAVLLLDVDRFKTVNDSLGHSVGDELLKFIANRLSNVVREIDTVARLGGDEFVILLTDINGTDEVIEIAERITESFKAPFLLDKNECYFSASIGISLYPEHGSIMEELLKCADTAMYRVKNKGRNGYCLYK